MGDYGGGRGEEIVWQLDIDTNKIDTDIDINIDRYR